MDVSARQAGTEVPLPPTVADLIERFAANTDFYLDPGFKEHRIRKEGIDPVLKALGWDVDNQRGATADREVVEEDALTVDGTVKAPDYAFRIDGRRQFFLEAKKPAVNIDTDRDAAFQIRRYCWTAGLPFGIVTDFEEWSVYDCRSKPSEGDPATVARIRHFRYDELADNWAWLEGLFGRDAVASGSLVAAAAANRQPQGTQPIDVAFLEEIRSWRESLAKNIAARNQALTLEELNSAVQNLIDRVIFLRIAEARGIETPNGLLHAVNSGGPGAYERLMELFRRADDRYNSGLFHFGSSGSKGTPDTVAATLTVDDNVLKTIVKRLYYPYPYEFSVMPADILGRVYEQFLGETITLSGGHQAQVETKPEVRKSGGVYYTPQPIVEYIVDKTIGPLIDGATPNQVANLRIVDPACGSGSFLIVAFQYLVDWHTAYYASRPRLARKHLETLPSGDLRLNTAERKRILLSSIHGVDIDPQAVEVTKLSLLLKVIEGQRQLELDLGRILPDLEANILCGNSIVDTDYPQDLLGGETRIAPFNWQTGFPHVFQGDKKFDAVIGNPPYFSVDSVWGKKDPRLAYLRQHYPDVYTDKTDVLFYFLARATQICDGEIGFIVSRAFLEADKARKLRGWLSEHTRVREVLDFRDAMVFKASINTAIIRLTKSKAQTRVPFRRYAAKQLPVGYTATTLEANTNIVETTVPMASLGAAAWNFGDTTDQALIAKIDSAGTPVGDLLHVGQGMQTGANKAFEITDLPPSTLQALNAAGVVYRRARTRDITAFHLADNGPLMLFPENHTMFASLPAAARTHLNAHKPVLTARAAFKRGDCQWWRYTWPLHKEHFNKPRIYSPYRARTNQFAVDADCDFLGITDTTVLYDNDQPESLHYIAGILNSDLLTYRHRFLGKLAGGGTYEFFENTVSKLPIPRRHPGDPEHDLIAETAEALTKSIGVQHSTRIKSEQEVAAARTAALFETLNQAVYALFGIGEDEQTHISTTLTKVQ
ncbi:MAG: N-6 DNA methylase [Candidatus Nanopelagicales bacterium]|nr:N-6 DNA methylase [Candidatus Nanopelagicales bacterium]